MAKENDRSPEESADKQDPLYMPDEISATRMRQQGLGMGAEELRLQRDPHGAVTTPEIREATETSAMDVDEADDREGRRKKDPRH